MLRGQWHVLWGGPWCHQLMAAGTVDKNTKSSSVVRSSRSQAVWGRPVSPIDAASVLARRYVFE